jgi:hypothetical protein
MAKGKRFTADEARCVGEEIGIDWASAAFDVEPFRRGMEVELEHSVSGLNTNVTDEGLRVSHRPAGRMRTVFEGNIEQAGESLAWRVNEMIGSALRSGYVPFFCECGDACFHTVWLDVFGYSAVISVPNAALLASGHGPSEIDESTEEASSSSSAAYRPLTSATEPKASPAGLDYLLGAS